MNCMIILRVIIFLLQITSYLKGFALVLLESVTEKVEKVTSVVYWFIGLFVFALFGKINELLSYPLCNILYTFRC